MAIIDFICSGCGQALEIEFKLPDIIIIDPCPDCMEDRYEEGFENAQKID